MKLFFDRGTLVVEGARSGLDVTEDRGAALSLPDYFSWDPRVELWRAPAFRLGEVVAWLKQNRIDYDYESPRPRDFAVFTRKDQALPDLRPYQRRAVEAWTAAGRRGVINLPTGSGKTRIAVRAILELKSPTVVFVPTRQLLHQWAASIKSFYCGAVGIYGDGIRDAEPVTVMTYESAHICMDTLGAHFDLLIVDEAHHANSVRLVEVGQMAVAPFRMGLSATLPEDAAKKSVVESVLGPVCFRLPIASLRGSYLADFEDPIMTRTDVDDLRRTE